MKADDVLKLLEKHESECNKRYEKRPSKDPNSRLRQARKRWKC